MLVRLFTWTLVLCLGLVPGMLRAQDDFTLSEPRLFLDGEKLVVEYDLWTDDALLLFEVFLEVKDANGRIIPITSVRGEVGKGVARGLKKVIVWDLAADEVVLSEEVRVDVLVSPIRKEPVAETPAPPSQYDSPIREDTRVQEAPPAYGGLLLRSAVFPGWGLSAYSGKPHWIKGVAAYACLGGSVALNNMAASSYDAFLAAETGEDAEIFLEEARSRDSASRIMAYSALGIWLADLAWTALATRKGSGSAMKRERGLSLHADMDPVSMQPMLGVAYRF